MLKYFEMINISCISWPSDKQQLPAIAKETESYFGERKRKLKLQKWTKLLCHTVDKKTVWWQKWVVVTTPTPHPKKGYTVTISPKIMVKEHLALLNNKNPFNEKP